MITISNIEIKTTKTGKHYKSLKLTDGNVVNMWSDDPEYANATPGATLDYDLEKDGQYWKLKKPERQYNNLGNLNLNYKPQSEFENLVLEQLKTIYGSLKVIAEQVGIPSSKINIHDGIDYPTDYQETIF
jgi:hypothetical protein